MRKYACIIVSSLFLCASLVHADIERVSVSSTGEQGNDESYYSDLNADGRYVVYESRASNLVDNDNNGRHDIFVHDRDAGSTELVSVSSAGEAGNDHSLKPKISANGRIVVFDSFATNLDSDFPGSGIFVHDLDTGITEKVNISTSGIQGNNSAFFPSVSANGRVVAFFSSASNLVDNDTNGIADVFVRDLETGVTERASVSSAAEQANVAASPTASSLSADGRYIAFNSNASNLVQGDTNARPDVFVHDRVTKQTVRVSVSTAGIQGNKRSLFPSISADGRFVAFHSFASNLVAGDTNGKNDIFIHDRETGITQRINITMAGMQGNGDSLVPKLSADGRFIAFYSDANNLVEDDNNDARDIFVHDKETGITNQVSVAPVATGGHLSPDNGPSISADGRFVSFISSASNLVDSDTNNRFDVFVADNPLAESNSDLIVEKLINNEARNTPDTAAQLIAGPVFASAYKVTNNSSQRLTNVQVFENGQLVCDVYNLEPGQTKQRWRCNAIENALVGDQQSLVSVVAKVDGSASIITSSSRSYYTGHETVTGVLKVTHWVDNRNADQQSQAQELVDRQARILFKVENTTNIELYRVKTYHDPVTPMNNDWDEQCNLGSLKPGQVRYCGRDITLTQSGLHKAFGRAQARIGNFGPIFGPSDVINASNPTYFIVP